MTDPAPRTPEMIELGLRAVLDNICWRKPLPLDVEAADKPRWYIDCELEDDTDLKRLADIFQKAIAPITGPESVGIDIPLLGDKLPKVDDSWILAAAKEIFETYEDELHIVTDISPEIAAIIARHAS